MAQEAPLYDLVVLLSENAPEEQRAKVLSDVEGAITRAGGSVERNDDWGHRPTAYEIRHQAEAEYHLLQFHSPPELIEDLSHTLHITDGVLRFRVIKNRPGTPPAPSSAPPVVATAGGGRGDGHRAAAPPPAAEPVAPPTGEPQDESPVQPAAEAPAEPATESQAEPDAETSTSSGADSAETE